MKSYLYLILLMTPLLTLAQIGDDLGSSRMVDWQYAGYGEDLPYAKKSYNLYSIKQQDYPSDTYYNNAFSKAMESVNGTELTEIYIPQGNYSFNSAIFIDKSNVIIRGEGSDKTILTFVDAYEPDVDHPRLLLVSNNIDNTDRADWSGNWQEITSGLSKGSYELEVNDVSALQLSAGDHAEIRCRDGWWYYGGNSYYPGGLKEEKRKDWTKTNVGQIVRIASIDEVNNKIYLYEEDKLRIDYNFVTHRTHIRKITPIQNVGIEDLCIKTTDPNETEHYNIYLKFAVKSWISGVESDHAGRSHLWLHSSSQVDVFGNYFHHAESYGGGGHGYGVTASEHSGRCLIENNIFRVLRHAMMVKQGSNGNVFGYNYSRESVNSVGDLSVHGIYPFSELFEGNIVDWARIDHVWGYNGLYLTFMRNKVNDGYILIENSYINYWNFVNNNAVLEWGSVLGGLGTMYYETNSSDDKSYYLSSAPSFWGNRTWPYDPSTNNQPAYERYYSGGKKTINKKSLPRIPKNISITTYNFNPKIMWDYNYESNIQGYEVWRQVDGGTWYKQTTTSNDYFIDQNFFAGGSSIANYKVRAVDNQNNKSYYSNEVDIDGFLPGGSFSQSELGIDELTVVSSPKLYPNYPNPFNPETTISFSLLQDSNVLLEVYNISGKVVTTLVNEYCDKGHYQVKFNAQNLPSGSYFYKISTENFTDVKRMLLIK